MNLARFRSDQLPDGTWGLCGLHNPDGVVRLVGPDGKPAVGGVCEHCWREQNDPEFYQCPRHGANRRVPGWDGCPIKVSLEDGSVGFCVGEGGGPTAAEIEREAIALSHIWPGGPPKQQDDVDAEAAGPASVGGGVPGAGAEGEPGEVRADDRAGELHGPAGSHPLLTDPPFGDTDYIIVVDPAEQSDGSWKDPFFVEES